MRLIILAFPFAVIATTTIAAGGESDPCSRDAKPALGDSEVSCTEARAKNFPLDFQVLVAEQKVDGKGYYSCTVNCGHTSLQFPAFVPFTAGQVLQHAGELCAESSAESYLAALRCEDVGMTLDINADGVGRTLTPQNGGENRRVATATDLQSSFVSATESPAPTVSFDSWSLDDASVHLEASLE